MIVLPELFIHDVVSNLDRLQAMLKTIGENWSIERRKKPADVVNQEYWVGGGAIDVVGTFDNRRHLVIVEVKAGTADATAIDQLKWYLDHRNENEHLKKFERVVGFLVAQDYLGVSRNMIPEEAFLFSFTWPSGNPFEYRPPGSFPPATETVAGNQAKGAGRHSALFCLEDHIDYIRDAEMKEAFKLFTRCFLDEASIDCQWVYANPKSKHVAVHYKGEYLIALWAKRKQFFVQYDQKGCVVTPETWSQDRDGHKEVLDRLRGEVDKAMEHTHGVRFPVNT
jgi:hypothetical protein